MSKKKTHAEYIDEVKKISPFIDVCEPYVDSQTPIWHYCNKHQFRWKARPYNIYSGKGCPECKKDKLRVAHRNTHEDYLKKLSIANPNVVPMEEYRGSNIAIDHYHKECGHITKMLPYTVLSGKGCILCKGKKISAAFVKSHEEFVKEIAEISPSIEICGTYVNSQTNIDCKCKVCGHTWLPKAQHLSEGHGCPNCSAKLHGVLLRKTHEQFVKEMQDINPYVKITGRYVTNKDKIACECRVCGYKWSPVAGDLASGRGCPNCKETIGERKIRAYLERHNILYVRDKKFDGLLGVGGNQLSYDFYLHAFRLLIEFQGQQHERPVDLFGGEEVFKKQQEHDRRKKNYALMHGYNFLEIFYNDIDNIESILEEQINQLQSETVTTTGVV